VKRLSNDEGQETDNNYIRHTHLMDCAVEDDGPIVLVIDELVSE